MGHLKVVIHSNKIVQVWSNRSNYQGRKDEALPQGKNGGGMCNSERQTSLKIA